MEINNKKYVMISNRGPNFTSNNTLHRGMGGTKEIYANLVDNFCRGWVCLASGDLQSDDVKSEYGNALKVIFVDKERYGNYYYKYVSEYLYPMLLGYADKAIKTHSRNDFDSISKELVDTVHDLYGKTDVMICDYHLFQIPTLIDWPCYKVFLWFIPILTEEYYFPEMKEIIWSLSQCDEIYFFNETWGNNFKKAFKYYFPNSPLKTKIRAVMMGPDDEYTCTSHLVQQDYSNILHKKLNIENLSNKRFMLSVSRMDFVKNIPLSIRGFEKYLDTNPSDKELHLILIAPHHRKDSDVYRGEVDTILSLVENSKYKGRIHLTNDYFNADELRILFKYADAFVCPSTFDAVPLTPLEYVLANEGNGGVVLSDSIGAYTLLFPNCYDFIHEDKNSLAEAIKKCMSDNTENKNARMNIMKSVILEETIQKAMQKIRFLLKNYE